MPDSEPTFLWLLTGLLLLPFAGFISLFGFSPRAYAGPVAILLTTLGLVASIWLAWQLPPTPLAYQADWVTLGNSTIPISFRLDKLAVLMLVLVHFIELLIQLYSIAYLHDEARLARYFAYLQLFVGAMLGIVTAGNLITLYAFWELVGLASYLLIGFWSDRPNAARAARKAFLFNRIGDAGFLLGIFLTQYTLGTTDFSAFGLTANATALPTLIGLCLFMGCVGKSAQFPLLGWLPDAMEGPTPVSALLHAATMVAAGIFLLARIHPLLSPNALVVITLIGTITTVWGGYSAIFQNDIKKVLAFSTVSQLGLMVAAMGMGNVTGALFHLLTHAFFKAGLFLGAGSVIHAAHTQDLRYMGGLRKAMPLTCLTYCFCALSLAGLPLFSGFLSKEAILAGGFGWAAIQGNGAVVVPLVLLLSSGLTALYMARQVQLIFFGTYRNLSVSFSHLHEPAWLMRAPVALLAGLSVWGWFSINPLHAHHSWFFSLFGSPADSSFSWLAPASIVFVLLGGWFGFSRAEGWLTEPTGNNFWRQLSAQYGFLDLAWQHLLILPLRRLSNLLYRTDERGIDSFVNGIGVGTVVLSHMISFVDRFGIDGFVNGAAWLAGRMGQLTRSVQTGRVQSYIATAVLGLLLILWWIL